MDERAHHRAVREAAEHSTATGAVDGSPEVVALDDEGRCTVLVSYSGRWSPVRAVHDGRWLAPVAHGDLDPEVPGPELYVGGERGNVYQVVGHKSSVLDARLVAELPGREVHTLVLADLEDRNDAGMV